jgi:hypothetical protein
LRIIPNENNQENQSAWHQALAKAKGSYLLFLDCGQALFKGDHLHLALILNNLAFHGFWSRERKRLIPDKRDNVATCRWSNIP